MQKIQNIFDNLIPQLQTAEWMEVFNVIDAHLPSPNSEQEEEPTE